MIYVPIRSDAAPYLSAAIYQLTRPPHLRHERDVSSLYCGWHPHPTRTDVVCLEVPEQEYIPIHSDADAEAIRTMLMQFVAAGQLTTEEVAGIADAIVASAGQTIDVAQLIPASWRPYVMTREQAIAGGWIAEPQIGVHP